MNQSIDLGRERHLSEILRISFSVYRNHIAVMLPIAALLVPLQLLSDLSDSLASSPLTAAALLFVVGTVTTGALVYASNEVLTGNTPTFGVSFEAIRGRIGSLLTTVLLGRLLTCASLIAFPYFAVRWALASQAVILEDKRNWAALDASSSLVRGHWWRAFGVLLLINIVWIISIPLGVTLSLSGVDFILVYAGSAVVLAVAQPFTTVAATLFYYDLRARHRENNEQPK